jgi:hypothetical protein
MREEASKVASSALWLAIGMVAAVLALVFALWTIIYSVALLVRLYDTRHRPQRRDFVGKELKSF